MEILVSSYTVITETKEPSLMKIARMMEEDFRFIFNEIKSGNDELKCKPNDETNSIDFYLITDNHQETYQQEIVLRVRDYLHNSTKK